MHAWPLGHDEEVQTQALPSLEHIGVVEDVHEPQEPPQLSEPHTLPLQLGAQHMWAPSQIAPLPPQSDGPAHI